MEMKVRLRGLYSRLPCLLYGEGAAVMFMRVMRVGR